MHTVGLCSRDGIGQSKAVHFFPLMNSFALLSIYQYWVILLLHDKPIRLDVFLCNLAEENIDFCIHSVDTIINVYE